MKIGLVALCVACAAAPALAQIEKPSENELDAAPPQFQNLVHGRSKFLIQTGPGAPKPQPMTGGPKPIPNPNHDPRDFRGFWASGGGGPGGGPGGPPGGGGPGGPPGGGPGGPKANPIPAGRVGGPFFPGMGPTGKPGVVRYTNGIDAARMCLVTLGPGAIAGRIYQDPYKLTIVTDGELRARRIWFSDHHTPDAPLSYNGDSIAHWEGNTLVVDTIRIKGVISQLDFTLETGAHELLLATPTLEVKERISKSADGSTLTDQATWIDPSVKKPPFTTTTTATYSTDPLGFDAECEDVGDLFGPKYGSANR